VTITFLGTGTSQGVPLIACPCEVCQSTDTKDKRLRSSIMIEDGGKVFVIDSGPDFREQMLRENVKQLDALIFTHAHRDHTAGLDDIRAFNFVSQKPLDVYLTEETENEIRKQFDYIFSKKNYPGLPELKFHRISKAPFTIHQTTFHPVEVKHFDLTVLGFRIGNFTYITDANQIDESEKKKIIGTKYLVLNALRLKKHISHFSLSEAIQLVNEIKPYRALFTHVSHQLGKYAEVNQILPQGIELAYDGMKIQC